MTKKEQKALEDAQKNRQGERKLFLDALKNYSLDIDAIKRVNRINGVETPTDLSEDVLKRYPTIKSFYENFGKELTFPMRRTENTFRWNTEGIFQHRLGENDLVIEDIRDKEGIINLIGMMHRFGYTRILYIDRSTRALEIISYLVEFGAKVVGTNEYIEYGYNGGLLIDVTEVNIESCLMHMCEDERNELIKHNAEWGRATKQEELDAIEDKYKAICKKVGA